MGPCVQKVADSVCKAFPFLRKDLAHSRAWYGGFTTKNPKGQEKVSAKVPWAGLTASM